MARFICGKCSFEKQVSDDLIGRDARCPKCNEAAKVLPPLPVVNIPAPKVDSLSDKPSDRAAKKQEPDYGWFGLGICSFACSAMSGIGLLAGSLWFAGWFLAMNAPTNRGIEVPRLASIVNLLAWSALLGIAGGLVPVIKRIDANLIQLAEAKRDVES